MPMNTPTEYQLLETDSREEMEEAVNAAMQGGWKPQGGIAYAEYTYTWEVERKGYTEREHPTRYVQALVR